MDEVQGFVSQRHRDLGIAALAAPELDSLFQDAARLNHDSAWFAHIPFAHWIVGAARPRVLVELGSHAGISYAAFCNAVLASGTGTRCYAVDTWRGDEQAGHYDETVFADLSRYHEQHFVAFSQLLRCTFDEAAGQFADGTIDLLHIDGLHTYEAIRHDFETWHPKLSDRAVVLFHDTNERLKGFGVWQLWAELTRRWPGFEFVHGHGLGVLCVGAEAPIPVRDICTLGEEEVTRLRTRFAFLGARWDAEWRAGRLAREVELRDGRIAGLEEARTAAAARAKEDEMSLAAMRTEAAQAASRHADAEAALAALRTEAAQAASRRADAEAALAALRTEAAHATSRHADAEAALAALRTEAAQATSRRADAEAALAALRTEAAQATSRHADTEAALAALRTEAAQATSRRADAEAALAALRTEAAQATSRRAEAEAALATLHAEAAQATSRHADAEVALAAMRTEAAQATSRHADAEAALITLRAAVQEARAAASSAEHVSAMSAEAAELAGRRAHEFAHRAVKAEREAQDARDFARLAEQAAQERDRLLHSTSWRVTAPLRGAMQMLPSPARRQVRRALKASYWGLTPWRMPARLAFLRSRRELATVTPAPEIPAPPEIPVPSLYARWIEAFETFPPAGEGASPPGTVQFSLLLPCVGDEESSAASLISLCRQTNPNWEAVLPDTPIARQAVATANADKRVFFIPRAAGERGATLAALLAASSGAWIGVLDAGDVLPERALDCAATAIASAQVAAILYSDEDVIDVSGERVRPQFKPSWSPELLHSYNYFGRLTLLSRALAQAVGGFAPGLGAGAEWALNLRAADRAAREGHPILRLPQVLCHRSEASEGDRPRPTSQAAAEMRVALQSYWAGRGIMGPRVSTQPDGTQRSGWETTPAPLVSVIIPNRNSAGLLRHCLTGVLEQTAYRAAEVLIVENGSDDPETFALYEEMERSGRVRVVRFEGSFNYSAACNRGAREARGSLLLFLNNDIEVEDPGWLGELVRIASLPGVGVVGTKLRYPTGEMQHGGVAVGPHLYALMFHCAREEEWGVFGSPNHTRNWSAIMGACQMVTREAFERVGGFEEAYHIANSDVALCLRAARLGYRTAYTPFAALVHHEGATRGRRNPDADMARAAREVERLGIEEDPYFHPGLSGEDAVPRLRAPTEPSLQEILRRNVAEHLAVPQAAVLDLFDDSAVLAAAETGRETVFWPPQPVGELPDRWAAARCILDLLRMRPDLRARFPRALSEGAGGRFASWLAGPAQAEMALPAGLAGHLDALFTSDPSARVRQVYFRREDLRALSPLGLLPPGRRSLVTWLFRHGRAEHELHREEIWWFLLACAEAPAAELVRLFRFTPDWQQAHPAGLTVFGRAGFVAWLAERYDLPGDAAWLDPATWPDLPGPAEQLRLAYAENEPWRRVHPKALDTPEHAQALLDWLACSSTGLPSEVRDWCAARAEEGLARSVAGLGANVIGHFCYPSGLRVSVEAMCDAMEGADVAVSRRDMRTEPSDDPYHVRFGGLEPHDVTIIHTQPEPFFAEAYSRADLAPRKPRAYRVAYWYWELDTVPSYWAEVVRGVDEVWAATRFVGDALRRAVDLPVQVLLPGVSIGRFTPRRRETLGAPARGEGRFAFLFSFHMASITERKNPFGLIRAFRQAFRAEEPVDLVIKTTSERRHKEELAALRQAAAGGNITIIDKVFTSEETLALADDCDAYVSLHRAEGLGLTIAEAMLLGKPVIATRYSGNLDFMSDENSLLVDCTVVQLGRDVPPYTAGAHWAEPSIAHAAHLMRRLYDDREFAAKLGCRAREDASQTLSLATAGRRFAERLAQIRTRYGGEGGRCPTLMRPETRRAEAPPSHPG